MRFNMKSIALLLVFVLVSGSVCSCSGKTPDDSNVSPTSDTNFTQSTGPTPTPSPVPSPTPTPEPRLEKMVMYYDPLTIGPNFSEKQGVADRKSEDKYMYLERYDAQGNVIFTSEYDPEVHDRYTVPTYTSNEYEFSEDGKLVARKNNYHNSYEFNYTYEYDDKGRLIKEVEESEESEPEYVQFHTSTTTYEYNEKDQLAGESKVVTESVISQENQNQEVFAEEFFDTTYEYDSEGHLVKEVGNYYRLLLYNHDEEKSSWQNIYTYDDRGFMIEEKKYYNEELQYDNTYKYDDNGVLIEDNIQDSVNSFIRTSYEYSGELLLKTTSQVYFYENGSKYENDPIVHIYEYNDLGNISAETIINELAVNDRLEGIHFYSLEYRIYSYNEDDLLESVQSWCAKTIYPDLTIEDIMIDDFSNGKKIYKYYYV